MSIVGGNIFAALDTKKSKKKSKSKDTDKKSKKSSKKAEEEQAEFDERLWSTPSLSVSNWADCDDEDEDFDSLGPVPDWVRREQL